MKIESLVLCVCASVVVACSAAAAQTEGDALILVKAGKPTATIITPDFPDEKAPVAQWTTTAAGWLREYVKKATGADLPVVVESQKPKGTLISVGHTKLAASAGITVDGLQWNGCRLAVKGNVLYLIGRDTYGPEGDNFLGAKGTGKAVTVFLEDFLNIRFFIPTPNGEQAPQRLDLLVPAALDKEWKPTFAYVTGRRLYGNGTAPAIANNTAKSVLFKTYGGHSWNEWIPASKYFDSHPEYFIEEDGQRVRPKADSHGHLCTSNPDVKRLLVENIQSVFDKGYEWVQLGQTDGFKHCDCDKCRVLDHYLSVANARKQGIDFYEHLKDHPCERVQLLHKGVIDACGISHPRKTVMMIAYGPTRWPSKKFDTYGSNVAVEVCCEDEAVFAAWKDKAAFLTTYVYFWGSYGILGVQPKTSPQGIAELIHLYRKYNVVGVYLCGADENWGLEGPVYYTFARMIGDSELNPADLLKDYCVSLFEDAGPEMIRFYNALYDSIYHYQKELRASKKKNQENEFNITVAQTPQELYPKMFPPGLLVTMETLLASAESKSVSKRANGWLKMVRLRFNHLKYNAGIFNLYKSVCEKEQADKSDLAVLQKLITQRKACLQEILAFSNKNAAEWFPECARLKNHIDAGDPSRRVSLDMEEPFTWNIESMLQYSSAVRKAAPDAGRLVYEENFEKNKAWTVSSQQFSSSIVKDAEAEDNGCRVQGEGASRIIVVGSFPGTVLKEGKRYRVTLWMRMNLIEPKQVSLAIRMTTGKAVSTPKYVNSVGGWQALSVDFEGPKNVPPKARILVYRTDDGADKTTAKLDFTIDDIRVLELK